MNRIYRVLLIIITILASSSISAQTAIDSLMSTVLLMSSDGLKIVCDDILDNGIGSSYKSHTFSLSDVNAGVTGYDWKFYLKDQSGSFALMSESASEKFTIDKVTELQDYYINSNGNLEGQIECSYTIGGRNQSAIPFVLSLELKPTIISIDNVSVIDAGDYTYSLAFDVNYIGTDYITVEVEEKYNTTLRTYRFDEPFIAHVNTGDITTLCYSWMTVIAANKFGTTSRTLEFAPSTQSIHSVESDNDRLNDVNMIQIFSIGGSLIFEGMPSEFQTEYVSPGIYLKKEFLESGHSLISKIIIQ